MDRPAIGILIADSWIDLLSLSENTYPLEDGTYIPCTNGHPGFDVKKMPTYRLHSLSTQKEYEIGCMPTFIHEDDIYARVRLKGKSPIRRRVITFPYPI